MNVTKTQRRWMIAGAAVLLILLFFVVSFTRQVSRSNALYRSLYFVENGNLKWSTQGRAWWEFRSSRNRWRAEYLLGRHVPTWGYVVQTKWFGDATLVLSWDPHDNSKVVIYRPNPRAPLPFSMILQAIARQERHDFWGVHLRQWFGEPPPIWMTLRAQPDLSPTIVPVVMPDQTPPAQGLLSNVRVSTETWTVLAFPDSKGQANRLASYIKDLTKVPNWKERLQLYDNVARYRPSGVGDIRETALFNMSLGHWGQALYYWHRRSLEKDQDFVFFRMFGTEMRARGLLKHAAYGFDRALQSNSEDPYTWKSFGDTLMVAKKYTIAIPIYKQLVKLRPQSSDARAKLAHAYDRIGNFEEAFKNYSKAATLDPKSFKAFEGLAHVAVEAGHSKEGAGYALYAIKLRPTADSYEDLCVGLTALKNYPVALKACQESLRLDPKRATGYTALGILYFNMRKLPEALAAFQKSDQLGKPNSTNLAFEGILFAQMDKLKEAVAALEKAIAMEPKSGKLHGLLSGVYAKMGNRPAVEREQKILSQLNPLPSDATH